MAQGFLWRVRRKLTLSYIFIGFVPVLLIVVFFLLCGLLLFFNVSSLSIAVLYTVSISFPCNTKLCYSKMLAFKLHVFST